LMTRAGLETLTTDQTSATLRPHTLRTQDGTRIAQSRGWVQTRIGSIACSITDQVLAAGAIFLGNVVLARTQSREEYGLFVLAYSIYTFVAGLHNAAILEAYTVFGSGKYSQHFREYLKLMVRSNAIACLGLMALFGIGLVVLLAVAPQLISKALFGLALT